MVSVALLRDAKQPNRFSNTTCDLCGTPMYRRPNVLEKNAGKYCSRACRNKAHPHTGARTVNTSMVGPTNPAWKGGVTLRRRRGNYQNVRYTRCPPDLMSMARADGYVMEHRLVMARRLRRPLLRVECVHHLDHRPLNNAETNLELWPDNRSHKMGEHGRIAIGAANRLFLTD